MILPGVRVQITTCCLPALAVMLYGAQAPGSIVLTHVAVVDVATGTLARNRTVTLVGDRIRSVSDGDTSIPPGARVLDAAGKFLLPGLWDMHVHLSYARSSALPAFVANGVTHVRDIGSRLAEIDHWRGEIAAGSLIGPTIVRAGPMLNGQESNRYQLAVTTAADAAASVRALHKAGVDFIKVHRRTSREAYFAVAEQAARLSLPLAGHVPMTVTPVEASSAGHRTFEHAITLFEGTFAAKLAESELPAAIAAWRRSTAAPELFATLVRNGTILDPTLVALRRVNAWLENPVDPRDKYMAASALREAADYLKPLRDSAHKVLAVRRALAREVEAVVGDMHRAGVRQIAGTDVSFTLLHPGFSLHDELQALVDVGLPPADALRAATVNAARLFPTLNAGEVLAGKRADLVLLDGNPLETIRHVSRIRAVIVGGRLFDRAGLDRLLADAAAMAALN